MNGSCCVHCVPVLECLQASFVTTCAMCDIVSLLRQNRLGKIDVTSSQGMSQDTRKSSHGSSSIARLKYGLDLSSDKRAKNPSPSIVLLQQNTSVTYTAVLKIRSIGKVVLVPWDHNARLQLWAQKMCIIRSRWRRSTGRC